MTQQVAAPKRSRKSVAKKAEVPAVIEQRPTQIVIGLIPEVVSVETPGVVNIMVNHPIGAVAGSLGHATLRELRDHLIGMDLGDGPHVLPQL